jgi:hypothetical protein
MVARISCPFSSFTLNIALLRASIMTPSCLMRACFAILFGCAKIAKSADTEKTFVKNKELEHKDIAADTLGGMGEIPVQEPEKVL